MRFELDRFVSDIRAAAASERATGAINTLMKAAVSDPVAVASCVPAYEGTELALYEDDTVSIFCVRFLPGEIVPPHDHTIPAFIGVYQGIEVNQLFRHDSRALELVREKWVASGETLSIGARGIHGVYTANGEESLALHVYLGRLKQVSRSLFHPETGEEMPFTTETYESLLRHFDFA